MFGLLITVGLIFAVATSSQDGDAPMLAVAAPEATPEPVIETRAPEDQTPTGKFTTATEIKPILEMTKAQWTGIREFNGQDLVYFTQLFSWRCGMWGMHYGLNGADPVTPMPLEPCNTEYAQPNVMVDIENFLPYIVQPLGSVEQVIVRVTFDDGTSQTESFERGNVRIP